VHAVETLYQLMGPGCVSVSRTHTDGTDVVVGTQMVSKGFDLPRVTAIGVVNADTGLHLPDFRSGERTFSYTDQLTGPDATGATTTCTVTRTVWYQDERSVYERAWVAERQDLSGIALYPLGTDAPAMWLAIDLARANTAAWPSPPGAVSSVP